MKEIFLICLLLIGTLPAAGTSAEPVVLLTNSIDRELNSDFIGFLEAERTVKVVDASEFVNYKNSKYIAILGGPMAPEGVGDIVESILKEQEKNELTTGKMFVKLNLWQEDQTVVLFAGPDRESTRTACQDNKNSYTSLLKAIETVRQEIITPDQKVMAFLWLQPLLTSDRIAPYAPSQPGTAKFPNLVPYPLKESSWFFWIDNAPYAKYAHPVQFVFFGIESEDSAVSNEEWWPVLNGKSLWAEEDEYWNSLYWVYNGGFSRSKSSAFSFRARTSPNQQEPYGQGLVVNGWKSGEHSREDMAEDEKGMTAAMEKLKFTVQEARTVKEMEKILKNLAGKMEPCNSLMIYITAHGDKEGVVIGGEKLTASEFAELLSNFEEGVHIFVIIDACYAGNFISDEMKKEAEVIITATSADMCAYRDWDPKNDPNPTDKGSEFTSGLVESLAYFAETEIAPTSPKDVYGRIFSPKDVYGRIFGKIEDIMLDAENMDAGALNGISDPQLWKATGKEKFEEGGGYT